MGIEFEVNTIEEMCALMCDNIIPEKDDHEDGEKEKGERRRKTPGTPKHRIDYIINPNKYQ